MKHAIAAVLALALLAAPALADLPNASLTPGAVADTDSSIVCAYGYARAHRNVPYAERDAVCRARRRLPRVRHPAWYALGESAPRLPRPGRTQVDAGSFGQVWLDEPCFRRVPVKAHGA